MVCKNRKYCQQKQADCRFCSNHDGVAAAVAPEQSSDNFRFAAAVAGWGLLLGESEYRASVDNAMILQLAKGAGGADEMGCRAETIRLVELAGALAPKGNREASGSARSRPKQVKKGESPFIKFAPFDSFSAKLLPSKYFCHE